MVKGMTRLKEISENVVADQLNIERYVKELTDVCREMFMASGSMFEQEHLRFITMFAASGGGGHGGGGHRFPKAIMAVPCATRPPMRAVAMFPPPMNVISM